MTDWNGWERLLCEYFLPTCMRVLGPYLANEGFSALDSKDVDGVYFSRQGIILELSYEIETAPKFSLVSNLGFHQSGFDEFGVLSSIPYWFVVGNDAANPATLEFRFSNERELEDALLRLRRVWLEEHARALWTDANALSQCIKGFRQESR